MIIQILDTETPDERKRLLDMLPYEYALIKHNGNKTRAGRWLGVTARCVTYAIRRHSELSVYMEGRQESKIDKTPYKSAIDRRNSYEHIE